MVRFEFHLARELRMTRAELCERISGAEFAYWMALYDLEAQERRRAQQDAEDKARARSLARSFRG